LATLFLMLSSLQNYGIIYLQKRRVSDSSCKTA
jgi:hypothetical protein